MGAVLTGMLLGHWYLVTPNLTVTPLARINLLFLWALIGQAGLVLIFNSGPWVANSLAVSEKWAAIYWLRVIVGIIFPLMLCYATIQTCKLKAHMSSIATLLTLALGYPLAYFIAQTAGRYKNVLLVLVIAPFFTSFLIRTLAWQTILSRRLAASRRSAAASSTSPTCCSAVGLTNNDSLLFSQFAVIWA